MKIVWDKLEERIYQTGIDHVILYKQVNGTYPKGAPWNGVTSISQNPSGAEATDLWADNMKYLTLRSAEEFGVTIECYQYPVEFMACNGEVELSPGVIVGQQRRSPFGLAYRTKKGNASEGEDYGYILHLVYGCTSNPSESSYETTNDSPEAMTFSFEITTTPVTLSGKDSSGKPFKPVSIISLDSTIMEQEKIDLIEKILRGSDPDEDNTEGIEPRLPLPDELKQILQG